MRVTEGRASRGNRRLCLALAPAVILAAGAPAFVPAVRSVVLWTGLVLVGGLLGRTLVYSVLARFWPDPPAPEAVRRPSFVFLIPCLNEITSLQQTLPALTCLRYGGGLRFCYVVEAASTDGSLEYVRSWARRDPRVVVLEKPRPPRGRGAAIAYGVENAPRADVVAFLDADHILRQATLNELADVFGQADPPDGVQGRCLTSNAKPNFLARVLTIERQWLERTELQVSPRLGGMSQFGGGQGFFRQALFSNGRFPVDDSMILDDTDLSFQLARARCRIEYRPGVSTESLQPETAAEFLDQRIRWFQGWLQLAGKHLPACFRAPALGFALRADMLRLLLTPYMAVPFLMAFAAAAVDALSGGAAVAPIWVRVIALAWPVGFALGVPVAGRLSRRTGGSLLALLGIPLLTCSHVLIACIGLAHMYVLRRPVTYAKTHKHDGGEETTRELPAAEPVAELDAPQLDSLEDTHQTVGPADPPA